MIIDIYTNFKHKNVIIATCLALWEQITEMVQLLYRNTSDLQGGEGEQKLQEGYLSCFHNHNVPEVPCIKYSKCPNILYTKVSDKMTLCKQCRPR